MEAEKEIKEFGETCTEVELYFQIDAIGAFIWRMRHDMSHGRIPEKDCEAVLEDVKKMSERQQILVEYVKRFDVPYEMVEVDGPFGKGLRPCEDYWKWYKKCHCQQ